MKPLTEFYKELHSEEKTYSGATYHMKSFGRPAF